MLAVRGRADLERGGMASDLGELERTARMRDTVVDLLEEASTHRPHWKPSAEQLVVLQEVADSTGPHLPPQAFGSHTVVVAFLLAAKATLDVRMLHLEDSDE
jgi:hypothetical protein